MPPSIADASRTFRSRMRPTSDGRKSTRRLFARGSTFLTAPVAPTPTPVDEEDVGRRSFLARPPEKGAARKVLSVLRDSKKVAASKRVQNASHQQPNLLAGTGYDDVDEVDMNLKLEVDVVSVESKDVEEEIEVVKETAKSESSSARSARSAPRPNLVEVEASIVSDDVTSSAGRSRMGASSRGGSSVPSGESVVQDADDLLFIDDCPTANIAFDFVGDEEDDVPEAPTSYTKQSWVSMEEHVMGLQAEVEKVRKEKNVMESALQEQNKDLGVLLESMRLRAAESAAEVSELTRQLKDTKRRLTRRVKELEEEVATSNVQHAEEIARYRATETHLRAEVEVLRAGRLPRADSSNAIGARRQRNVMQQALKRSRELDEAHSVSTGVPGFARAKSTSNVQHNETVRRKGSRHEIIGGRTWGGRRAASPIVDVTGTQRGEARRSLVRRALIAHVHSNKYKSARAAWHGFLGADGGQVSPDQFSRAVRGLAVAANAPDRDLELLREEVCGAEFCDTGVVTWGMFARFYQQTKSEST